MILVFGVRHFTVKTYHASELGFTDPSWSNTRFEAVQKYFHLMYIPFFPVGQMIGVRGSDGKLYHLTAPVAAQINTYQLTHKAPWYSFIGLMLIGLIIILSAFS